MSFDEYAEHIYQKHRLCVALAVLRTKPPEVPSLQYLEQLKSKMADNMDDDDLTVCSDDFLMDYDDESINILKDFNEENIDDVMEKGGGVFNDDGRDNNYNTQPTPDVPEELSQATYYNSSQSQKIPTIIEPATTEVNFNENHHIINNMPNRTNNIEKPEPYLNTLSQNDLNIKDYARKTNVINRPIIDYKSNKATEINNNNIVPNNNISNNKIDDTYFDSQKTILYTVPAFTQNYTHYSASQTDMVIPSKYIHGIDRNMESSGKNNTESIEIANLEVNNENTNIINTNLHEELSINPNDNTEIVHNETIPNENSANKNDKTQPTDNFSQMKDDVPQHSQKADHLESINQKYKATNNKMNENDITNTKDLQYSQNLDDYFNEIQSFIEKERLENINNENTISLQYASERISNPSQNIDYNNDTQIPITNPDNNSKDTQEINMKEDLSRQVNNKFDEEFTEQNNENAELSLAEEESEVVEIIPYKVLGELSKIKMFLRRRNRRMSCDGFSTDSGYRSDSQIRSSSRSGLQLSGISMNQSAYSLLNHIVQCPLVEATREITAEIAQTLGQLINRLHEEETYPPFLEELLDTVDILLRQVYKGASSDHAEFLKKDDFLERLLLLNKSIHIQKHTIDKITIMLTKFHEKLVDENVTYELTNIDEIENSCYIFHILEILLKKYIKNKSMSSQSGTQLSQEEDKVLKKSAITDIWRRKWNPNLKEVSEGSRENRCILKSCSDILNKIVVDCVNSYSLVAFSALKCFNSMQS